MKTTAIDKIEPPYCQQDMNVANSNVKKRPVETCVYCQVDTAGNHVWNCINNLRNQVTTSLFYIFT